MDAWAKLDNLIKENTKEYEVRNDIHVTARGCDRGVEVVLGYLNEPRGTVSTGRRNVGTMRELADAINAACDLVEELNPVWATYDTEHRTINP